LEDVLQRARLVGRAPSGQISSEKDLFGRFASPEISFMELDPID
jgi:hypothetical protein